MSFFSIVKKTFFNIFRWLTITVITFLILSIVGAYIADKYFDNAAKKDSCLDSGGAWDHAKDTCIFGPEDPRTKRQECKDLKGVWNFEKKECVHKVKTYKDQE